MERWQTPALWALFISVILLTGCSKIIGGLYGLKSYKTLEENEIVQYSEKLGIPFEDVWEIDTGYRDYLFSMDTAGYGRQIKNHMQPLQALYFNRSGNLESYQINCYAGGFINLKWNRGGIMSVFPPLQQAPVDSLLSLERQLGQMKMLKQTARVVAADYDYVVIVYWNRFMLRQSRRLIHYVRSNAGLAGDQKVRILYANNDNLYGGPGTK